MILIPIALLAFGLRQDAYQRLSEEYQHRVDSVVETIRDGLARECGHRRAAGILGGRC